MYALVCLLYKSFFSARGRFEVNDLNGMEINLRTKKRECTIN